MSDAQRAMQVLRNRIMWRSMNAEEQVACLDVTQRCARLALAGADPFLAPVRSTRRMYRFMVEACGLMPGIVLSEDGQELPGWQVIDLPRALLVSGMAPVQAH